jgi:hypothetical protein
MQKTRSKIDLSKFDIDVAVFNLGTRPSQDPLFPPFISSILNTDQKSKHLPTYLLYVTVTTEQAIRKMIHSNLFYSAMPSYCVVVNTPINMQPDDINQPRFLQNSSSSSPSRSPSVIDHA